MMAFTGPLRPVDNSNCNIMKHIPFLLLAVSAFVIASCDKQKEAIDDATTAKKQAIDERKDAVNAAAKDAIKQTDVTGTVDKANIEANKTAVQAQLDADKKKADAEAAAAKARVDAEKK